MRRLAHYDYWSDSVKPSWLVEGGADLLVYGMAELTLQEVAAILAGVFVYIFLLMALRVIGEAELSGMPLGFFFILLGKNLGIL